MYTDDGKPKHSIFYIAHLSETERMFIVTLLYSAIETWMRSQAGTTSLRALVYFDEIFGYLPPTANPPSKKPMLRMLKQARAFGVGMVVATQNPVDIDYKGLSNAGTWFVGRLQTERDKERLLDGLQGASGGDFDRSASDQMLSGLGKRVFLVNNVHSRGGPELFQTRWAMNYMAGPMTRNQIRGLNKLAGAVDVTAKAETQKAPVREVDTSAQKSRKLKGSKATVEPVASEKTASPAVNKTLKKYTETRPAIASGLDEYFLPRQYSFYRSLQRRDNPASMNNAEKLGLVYLPGLLMQLDVLYTDRKGSYSERRRYATFIPDPERRSSIDFEKYTVASMDPDDLDQEPEEDALYGDMDAILKSSRKVSPLSKQYINHIYREAVMPLLSNKALKMTSDPNEAESDFLDRCRDEAEDRAEAEIDKVQTRFDKQLDRLNTKLRREERELDEDRDTLQALKLETMVSYSKTIANIAGGIFGRRSRRSSLGSSLTKRRQKQNAEADVRESLEEIDALRSDLDELTEKHKQEMLEIAAEWRETAADIEVINVSPLKKNIELEVLAVAWQPHWVARVEGRTTVIPAG